MMILKPFDSGDTVRVAGVSGEADEMPVVSATIRTFDNQIVTIPNGKICWDVITNVSASETRRVDLVFRIDYSDCTSQAIKALEDLAAAMPQCLCDPKPQIFVGEMADSSVNIFCRPWVRREDYRGGLLEPYQHGKGAIRSQGVFGPFSATGYSFHSRPQARRLSMLLGSATRGPPTILQRIP